MADDKKRIIDELSLIRNIVKYILIDNSETVKRDFKEQSKLEERILNEKRLDKKKDHNLEFLEQVLFELENNKERGDFSIDIKKEKKEIEEAQSLVIKYQENEREQRLKVEAKDDKKAYSLEIVKEKEVPDNQPYELNIIYENNKTEEKLGIKYSLRDYPAEREQALQDFTNRVDKTLHIFPKSIMGGVLGFTYLGENFMGRRDDLVGSKALMVDVHEAIHTPDEYETRVLTDWILSRERMRYKR